MRYQIELTHSNPIPTAVIRSWVPAKELAKFVPAACGEVWSFIRSAGLPRPGRHLALYLDAQGSVEVGAEVSEPFAGNARIHCVASASVRRPKIKPGAGSFPSRSRFSVQRDRPAARLRS